MIECYVNGRPYQLDNLDPNLSVLDWLRISMRLRGTKEGCASGDCGACTVVLGRANDHGAMHYVPINSCIALIGSLHGAHLITVDALQQEPPHPVQQALIDCHGSQCGFCTPGFVMSLFALHQNQGGEAVDDHSLLEALSGNLCRCTGYRPIIAAGHQAMVQQWHPDPDSADSHPAKSLLNPSIPAELDRINAKSATLQDHQGHWYEAPTSLSALRALLQRWPEARLIAGSTDLALEITQQLKTLPQLISVQQVPELQVMAEGRDGIVLGAALSYEALRSTLTRAWPAFEPMLARLGSRQIRYRGTLGGNIGNASPVGDMPPPLIALGATLTLDGPSGERALWLEDFFLSYKTTDLQPGEFIKSVRIPQPGPNERLFVYKISKRLDDDISAVLGAFWLRFDGNTVATCRLAWGGMAATPARSRAAEAALNGQPWSADSVQRAINALASDLAPLSDARASADYRLQVAGNLLQRALLSSSTEHPLTVTDYA